MAIDKWAKRQAILQRAEKKMDQLPYFDGGVLHPFPIVPRTTYKSVLPKDQLENAIRQAPIEQVRVADLTAGQVRVFPERLWTYVNSPDALPKGPTGAWNGPITLPIVIKYQGRFIVHDGTHRATAAWLRGDKIIQARVVDLDALSQRKPGLP